MVDKWNIEFRKTIENFQKKVDITNQNSNIY